MAILVRAVEVQEREPALAVDRESAFVSTNHLIPFPKRRLPSTTSLRARSPASLQSATSFARCWSVVLSTSVRAIKISSLRSGIKFHDVIVLFSSSRR